MEKRIVATLILCCLLGACSVPTRLVDTGWFEVKSKHFRIVTNARPEEMRLLVEDLERFRAFANERFDSTTTQKLTIYALHDFGSYEALLGIENSRRTDRVFMYTPHGSFVVLNLSSTAVPAREILFHEYIHFLTFDQSPLYLPPWFSEGIAEYYSTTKFLPDGQFEYGALPVYAQYRLKKTDPLSLKELLRAQWGAINPRDGNTLYGGGWALTHWLMRDENRKLGLKKYLQAYSAGADPVAAFAESLGTTIEQLEQEYKSLPKQRFDYFRGQSESTRPIEGSTELQALPIERALAELARFMAASGAKPSVLEALSKYAEIRRADSPALIAAVSIAKAKEKKFTEAQSLLDSIPAEHSRQLWFKDAEATLVLEQIKAGGYSIDEADLKAARDRFVDLINSRDAVPAYWYGLAITLQQLGYPREQYIEMLEQAYLRIPQNLDIAWWYAHEVYLNRDAEAYSSVASSLIMKSTDELQRHQLMAMMSDIGPAFKWMEPQMDMLGGESLASTLARYRALKGYKALAVAVDYRGAIAVGLVEESLTQSDANREALSSCERQRKLAGIRGSCQNYAEGDRLIEGGTLLGAL